MTRAPAVENRSRTGATLAPVLALALGGFGIGLTEFVASGLLPQIAHDLLGRQYARSNASGVAHAGWIITTYAAGVVVGAPLVAFGTARIPRRRLVLGLLVLFVVGTVASALAPNFPLLLVARFVAGLPHGAYFGAAGLLAASIMGPGRNARGFALVLGGLTTANIVGVPLITRLGQATSWRISYLAIAGVFALTFLAVLAVVPEGPAGEGGSPHAELSALASARVWLVVVMVSIGFAGFFAVDSYIAPITTHLTHLSSGVVPWVLVAVGLGMTTGNAIGGWSGDRDPVRSLRLGFPVFMAALALFALVAADPIGLFAATFLISACALFLQPAMQVLLIAVAPQARLMGAALNQSASNIANSIGAAVGSLAIGHGLGYRAPGWFGLALAAVGWLLVLLVRRPASPPDPAPGAPGGQPV